MSTGTIFPIGHYCGVSPHGPDSAVTDQGGHLVRVGYGLERLTDDEFGIWILAHGLTEVGRDDWTAEHILDRAAETGVANPAEHLDELFARGLLALVPTRPEYADESVAFASAYRIGPLLVGLGAVPDEPNEPDQHAIGVPGVGTAALLDPACYELWQRSGAAATVWQLCQERVERTTAISSGLEGLLDPTRLLAQLLGELRTLIVHGCAYLDVAVGNESGVDSSRAPDETDENTAAPLENVPE